MHQTGYAFQIIWQNQQLHHRLAYQEVEDGLKIYGKSNTVNLMPAIQNLVKSKTIYLKWKANGNGHPVNVGVELYTDSENLVSGGRILNLCTNQSTSGSVSIVDNKWYYTRISVLSGNATSTGNYDNRGGEIISNISLKINSVIETFSFQTFADNSSYTILAESWIE